MATDYKATVFLPKTDFPMKADLPRREPDLLAYWQRIGLFGKLRAAGKGREKFILHDGPPYANGHIHIGTALNKILKDLVNRSQQMLGKDANYVPGWDCHGLPIEWKIEEEYRAKGRNKDAVPINEFRRECRDFARKWIDIQRAEFKRLGVEGDWDHPYATMDFAAEAQIFREMAKFLMNGGLYRGWRPVLWSVVEKTALADAEVEYHDHKSTAIHVRFPVLKSALKELGGASIVIWTTTPWTMPGNRAICFGPDFDYVLVEVVSAGAGSLARAGERFVVLAALLDQVVAAAKIAETRVLARFKGSALEGTVCAHPLRGRGYEFDVPLLPGDHVTTDQGTGLVHTAPGHGAEDFEIGRKHGLEIPHTVAGDGLFLPEVPLFAGKHVYKVDGEVADALNAAGQLLARGTLVHSYPHSWRSKAPLIFRNTPQWFISMERGGLRKTALAAIDQTRWVPAGGRNRLFAMIEQRPDWTVSRQRAWGVPLALFIDRKSGEPLRDDKVNERIAAAFEVEGGDAWFSRPAQDFLGADYREADYDQVKDVIEVWFESGSTHSFVLEKRPELKWPASLYLEGSDQHRGWFHTSLLESCGTRGRAPFEAVLTHGFVLDEHGRKMSKSLGNVVAPQEVMEKYGADILRLWVVASDYTEDLGIGPDILKQQVEVYRRMRNTLRYLLGALNGFLPAERLPREQMPELERFVLHRLYELDRAVRQGCADFAFNAMFSALHNFCAIDLSAFYFDVRKDALYCDPPGSLRRRAVRTVLDDLFNCLTAWIAPVLCFTAEEAWQARGGGESVHLRLFPEVPAAWRDDGLAARWEAIRTVRRVVTGALELERAAKRIGSSLQAAPSVFVEDTYREALAGVDLAEVFITSGADLFRFDRRPAAESCFAMPDAPGIAVAFAAAPGDKCQRCWKVLPEVGRDSRHADICGRCADAVEHLAAAQ